MSSLAEPSRALGGEVAQPLTERPELVGVLDVLQVATETINAGEERVGAEVMLLHSKGEAAHVLGPQPGPLLLDELRQDFVSARGRHHPTMHCP